MSNHVLLVDDDTRFSMGVRDALSDHFTVIVAASPSEAMLSISKLRPSLILLDFNMPDMTGLEFLKILRRRFDDLPVIMLTGQSDSETIIETMKNGASDFVIKGSEDFEINLRFRINKALEQARLLQRNKELSTENLLQTEENKKLAYKIDANTKSTEIIGNSPEVLILKSLIQKVKGSAGRHSHKRGKWNGYPRR